MKKYAILIGINQYHESLGRLKYSVNDCRRLAQVLTAGDDAFPAENVIVLADDDQTDHKPTYANIHSWLASWLAQPDEDDTVLVFFAGHGREVEGKCYLVPGDATLQTIHVTGIPVPYIQELLNRCKARQKVLILDACHSGAGRDVSTMAAPLMETLSAGKGIYTLTSCDVDELSHEWDEKKQAVFSYYLAEALSGSCPPDAHGRITAEAVYEWTFANVRRWATSKRCQQSPMRFSQGSGTVVIRACVIPGSNTNNIDDGVSHNLMTATLPGQLPQNTELASSSLVPNLVGRWYGYYVERGRRYPFKLIIEEQDEPSEMNCISFRGVSTEPAPPWSSKNYSELIARVDGTLHMSSRQVSFRKHYNVMTKHKVHYSGRILTDRSVIGEWTIGLPLWCFRRRGSFVMRPETPDCDEQMLLDADMCSREERKRTFLREWFRATMTANHWLFARPRLVSVVIIPATVSFSLFLAYYRYGVGGYLTGAGLIGAAVGILLFMNAFLDFCPRLNVFRAMAKWMSPEEADRLTAAGVKGIILVALFNCVLVGTVAFGTLLLIGWWLNIL